MGFPNGLKITSAARTPYNQAIQIATRPVAAGMFGSGHLCGISVDFDNEPAITANYDAFAKLMSKHGLFCDPALKPGAKNSQGKSMADPKHVYLGAGFSRSPNFDKAFANDLMTQCLGAYQDAMTNERSVQNAKSGELASENKTLNNIIANMDTHLKDVQGRLDKLKSEKDNLDKQKMINKKGWKAKHKKER
ncbi:MAG: hypothetical protein HWD58_19820 [Bacteroidota bacterium]|nr:MAG: hypothetical protein HWD58_19820 [Bacteroidota bacterium]